jgi:hypothetical protein
MNKDQVYEYARSKGLSVEKSVELSLQHAGKSSSEIGELVACAIAIPVAGAIVVDQALGGIPSTVVGTAAAVGLGILGFFL